MTKRKALYIVTEDKKVLEKAEYTFVMEIPSNGQTFYVFFNDGLYSKINRHGRKKLFYTNKLYL